MSVHTDDVGASPIPPDSGSSSIPSLTMESDLETSPLSLALQLKQSSQQELHAGDSCNKNNKNSNNSPILDPSEDVMDGLQLDRLPSDDNIFSDRFLKFLTEVDLEEKIYEPDSSQDGKTICYADSWGIDGECLDICNALCNMTDSDSDGLNNSDGTASNMLEDSSSKSSRSGSRTSSKQALRKGVPSKGRSVLERNKKKSVDELISEKFGIDPSESSAGKIAKQEEKAEDLFPVLLHSTSRIKEIRDLLGDELVMEEEDDSTVFRHEKEHIAERSEKIDSLEKMLSNNGSTLKSLLSDATAKMGFLDKCLEQTEKDVAHLKTSAKSPNARMLNGTRNY